MSAEIESKTALSSIVPYVGLLACLAESYRQFHTVHQDIYTKPIVASFVLFDAAPPLSSSHRCALSPGPPAENDVPSSCKISCRYAPRSSAASAGRPIGPNLNCDNCIPDEDAILLNHAERQTLSKISFGVLRAPQTDQRGVLSRRASEPNFVGRNGPSPLLFRGAQGRMRQFRDDGLSWE
jgi:hypothetical protein